ncbi:MAG: hypothetical protein IJ809_07320 [Clostridia bacterium]|nr:hypothetical protein [Clostridia bacterium]
MDNSARKTSKYNVKNISISIICIILFSVIIYIVSILAKCGEFSKLKYSTIYNRVEVPFVSFDAQIQEYASYVANDDTEKIKQRTDELANEMTKFIKSKYGFDLVVPKYNIYIADVINMGTDGYKDKLSVYVSKKKLLRPKENYETLLIHEMFHVLSAQDGYRTRINAVSEYPSKLIEGYTNILTDEFLEYMGYDDYIRIIPRSEYMYYSKICETFFVEKTAELEFAKYYFYNDYTFTENFNKRVKKAANTSFLYNPYENFEMHMVSLDVSDKKNAKCQKHFLASYELLSFYCSSMSNKDKKIAENIFEEIEKYMDINMFSENNPDYSYFHNIIWNKI